MIKKCKCGYSYETTWQSKPTYMYKRERKSSSMPYIQRLKERIKKADHIIEAILVRSQYVMPTYLAMMAKEYSQEYEHEIPDPYNTKGGEDE